MDIWGPSRDRTTGVEENNVEIWWCQIIIFFLLTAHFLPGTFCYFPESRAFINPDPYQGKPRITDILANISGQSWYENIYSKVNFRTYCTHDNTNLRQNVQYMDWSSLLRPSNFIAWWKGDLRRRFLSLQFWRSVSLACMYRCENNKRKRHLVWITIAVNDRIESFYSTTRARIQISGRRRNRDMNYNMPEPRYVTRSSCYLTPQLPVFFLFFYFILYAPRRVFHSLKLKQ